MPEPLARHLIEAGHVWYGKDPPLPAVEVDIATRARMVEGTCAAARALASPDAATRDDLPLPDAQPMFDTIIESLEHGPGFALVRGLPFDSLDYAETVVLALALADHLGTVTVQNYEGQRIVDVRDDGVAYSHRSRGYRGNAPLPFHTDGGHRFVLAALGRAAEGGETILVSAAAVYNALLAEAPDLLEVLAAGFYHHRRGQHDEDESPLSPERVPVFQIRKGLLHCCYNRNPIEWAEKEGVRLDDRQRAALDAMDAVLARPELQLALNLEPGDLLVVNNFCTLHSRTHYRDDAGHRRHLLRIWMEDPSSRWAGISLIDLYVPERYRLRAG